MTRSPLDIPFTPDTGHSLALFPGSFRPPHAAHLKAVQHLLSHPAIDEVVIIISNRSRPIPTGNLVLPADVSRAIWNIYLKDIPRVRIEVAPQTAVRYALDYIHRVRAGDKLLFCLGEADFHRGDSRFQAIQSLGNQYRIKVETIQAPTSTIPIRSSVMREALAQGQSGWDLFRSGLPPHLTDLQKRNIWRLCQDGLQDLYEITGEKILTLLRQTDLGILTDIRPVHTDPTAPVFRVRRAHQAPIIVKYAGDYREAPPSPTASGFQSPDRLKVERRALRWLRAHRFPDVDLPEILFFDKKARIMVMTDVCPKGWTLEHILRKGRFDPVMARKAFGFLAVCHASRKSSPACWLDGKDDCLHWKHTLSHSIQPVLQAASSSHIIEYLSLLAHQSEQASRHQFVHLRFSPKHIRFRDTNFGVVGFEQSSGFGDPAFDIGTLAGHYVYWALRHSFNPAASSALQAGLDTYHRQSEERWEQMQGRIVAFAGIVALTLIGAGESNTPAPSPHWHSIAETLMIRGTMPTSDGKTLLVRAAEGLM